MTVALGASITGLGVIAIVAGRLAAAEDRRTTGHAGYLRSLEDGESLDLSGADEFAQRLSRSFLDRVIVPTVQRLIGLVALVTPSDHRVRVRTRLAQAGLDLHRRPEEIIALQVAGAAAGVALGIVLLLSGSVSLFTGIATTVLLFVLGAAAPMVWLTRKVDERMAAIRADLPDTLDLLAISVEAGVGLEGAMSVVTERFRSPLADEMARTLQEMGLGLTRRDALSNLKLRSQVPELTSFVQALIQADTLGMPLGRVLKVQAGEMRLRRRQWAREKAAKLPVKIMLPLVFCIFPAILVVVLGPAVSQIGGAL